MRNPASMRMLGLVAIANTLAISGGCPLIESPITPRDPSDREPDETPQQRAVRRADETIITAENKHEFLRYIKAEEKRKRKAAKRLAQESVD